MSEDIKAELDRVLSSSEFRNCKRVSQLLKHIIKTHLENKSESLTGIAIAQDLFGKDEYFDPAKDPVVRVNMARLRKMLKAYYKNEGAENPLKITIPLGAYKPNIIKNNIDTQRKKEAAVKWLKPSLAIVLSALFVFASYFLYHLSQDKNAETTMLPPTLDEIQSYPTVAVLPFQNQTLNPKFDNLKEGFQRQVTVDLYPFRVIRVLKTNKTLEDLFLQSEKQPDYAITGAIKNLEQEINLTLQLIDVKTRDVVLTEHVRRLPGSSHYYGILADISAELSNNFVGPEGAIVKRLANATKTQLSDTSHRVKDLSAIECFSRFMDFREDKTYDSLDATYQCLHTELDHNPKDATLMSALSTVYYEIGFANENPDIIQQIKRFQNPNLDSSITRETARDMARKAIEIDPRNDIAHGYLADMQMADNDISGALITLEQAMASNRGNPNHISNTALVLAYLGRWEEAIPLAKEAIARHPDPEPYYYLPLFYHALMESDGEALKANYDLLKPILGENMDLMFRHLVAAMTDNQAGLETTHEAVQEWVSNNREDPFYVIKFSGGSDEIFAAMKDEFEKSGIVF
jgi:TolB-like protein